MSKTVTSIADLQRKSKLPAKQAGGNTVKEFFERNKQALVAVAPKLLSPDRMLKISLGAIRTTPKLQECTVESLFGAVVACAQLGLEPNTPMGHAYLIPFRDTKKNRTDVQVIIGYRGLIDLARRSGQIVSISAHEVCEHDEFEWEYGLDEKCKHIPAAGERGAITHFYAVAKLVGGGHAFEVMTREQVEHIRDNAQNYRFAKNKAGTVWGKHFGEMGRKTVIRRLYKYLPTSIEMAAAAHMDGLNEGGESQGTGAVLEGDFNVLESSADAEPEDGKYDAGTLPLHDSAGEVFDEKIHLAPDRKNADGTFTKRPQRQKKAADPVASGIKAMTDATSEDELDEARATADFPGMTDADKSKLNDTYEGMLGKFRGSADPDPMQGQEPPDPDNDDDFEAFE